MPTLFAFFNCGNPAEAARNIPKLILGWIKDLFDEGQGDPPRKKNTVRRRSMAVVVDLPPPGPHQLFNPLSLQDRKSVV